MVCKLSIRSGVLLTTQPALYVLPQNLRGSNAVEVVVVSIVSSSGAKIIQRTLRYAINAIGRFDQFLSRDALVCCHDVRSVSDELPFDTKSTVRKHRGAQLVPAARVIDRVNVDGSLLLSIGQTLIHPIQPT